MKERREVTRDEADQRRRLLTELLLDKARSSGAQVPDAWALGWLTQYLADQHPMLVGEIIAAVRRTPSVPPEEVGS